MTSKDTVAGLTKGVTRFYRNALCRLGLHKNLDVIQTFGSAQHIGCPNCGREYGIHHGERVVIPWTSELAELYDFLGYETEAATRLWRNWRFGRSRLAALDEAREP